MAQLGPARHAGVQRGEHCASALWPLQCLKRHNRALVWDGPRGSSPGLLALLGVIWSTYLCPLPALEAGPCGRGCSLPVCSLRAAFRSTDRDGPGGPIATYGSTRRTKCCHGTVHISQYCHGSGASRAGPRLWISESMQCIGA